jgi:16S rRNA C967 or C1407 C5-methylase (RsmB/RsmF family)/NOL1/NOP2/fmu family ribosome biogenesis protein
MISLPVDFADRMRKQLGNEFELFHNSLNGSPSVSVRENPFKKSGKFNHCEKIAWSHNAFYLPERISFTLDPLFHAGCYYVQEASSMYIETALEVVIKNKKPLKVLDLCAAPGGKSTHLLSILPLGSVLVCNEVIPSRNKILQQNISKWGVANAVVTQNDAADFKRLPNYFDIIVIDAPCSGEGLFRKDPDATNEWSLQAVDRCVSRQSEIIADVKSCLKNEGLLVYSTCTYESTENDEQVKHLIQQNLFTRVPLMASNGIHPTEVGVQFYPHKIKGEGFYLALLQKKYADGGNINYSKPEFSAKHKMLASDWLENVNAFQFFAKENELYAVPDFMKQDFTLLMKNLYVRQAGIHLGQVIKNELVPSHQLAQFIGIHSKISRVNLELEVALKYLRCETIVIPELKRGWHLACFEGFALGWMKGLGNRINNYYPKELRILMKG